MIDMSATTAPKSDQLNSDDLIGGPRTIKITRVAANEATPEQPINIFFEGDNGKPYRPCKSMRRVMVDAWGKDATAYVGRSLTLYRDPDVVFGGLKVGGTRISHMSHIEGARTMALTATRAQRKPFTVRPLADQSNTSDRKVEKTEATDEAAAKEAALEALYALKSKVAVAPDRATALAIYEGAPDGWPTDLYEELKTAVSARLAELKRKPTLDDQVAA